jgi:CheY-like chemotaxis protein
VSSRKASILLAEDSPDNVILIKTYLRNTNFKVSIASNGLEAVELATKNAYDLILMDIQMPEMDGYEATQKLREAHITIPVIALTAHALAEHKANAINAGFDEYLTKPIRRDVLMKVLNQHLS